MSTVRNCPVTAETKGRRVWCCECNRRERHTGTEREEFMTKVKEFRENCPNLASPPMYGNACTAP